MEDILSWIDREKEWLFSGLGLAVVLFIGRRIFKNSYPSTSQNIRAGDGSTNVQAGRDVNIVTGKKGNDLEGE
ncbi:MAG: hypothetical protein KME41_17815 [Candidatus Thiodiazotropha sp. (ex Lucina pensylvanica)]|nr:hypothetical protein [Candidatus Thiodiazotropha sp. (ex Lucina pensylvanica)]